MSGKSILSFALLIFVTFVKSGCNLKTLGTQQAAGSQTKGQVQFKDEGGGTGTTEDGHEFSFHRYKSHDEVWLSTYIEICPSPELAKKAMDEKVKEAASIIARGPRLDRNGEYLGERVVLIVEKKTQGKGESISFICWTANSSLHCIQSKSLKHALAYEKILYP